VLVALVILLPVGMLAGGGGGGIGALGAIGGGGGADDDEDEEDIEEDTDPVSTGPTSAPDHTIRL
jgi:hypothetical protein